MEKKVTHCPKCQKPTMNGGQFMGAAQFKIKCPWCQAVLRITVQPKITAEILNGEEARHLQDSFNPFANQSSNEPINSEFENFEDSSEKSGIPPSGMKVVGYLYPDKQ